MKHNPHPMNRYQYHLKVVNYIHMVTTCPIYAVQYSPSLFIYTLGLGYNHKHSNGRGYPVKGEVYFGYLTDTVA